MTQPSTPPARPLPCPSCGAPLSGPFCSQCGQAARAGACVACGTPLTPGARFCHRCGAAAGTGSGAGRERLAWALASLAALAALLAFLYRGNMRPAVPDMGNAGNVEGRGGAPPLAQGAPDISSMTPRERFDRLWDRVVRAAEAGDSVTVIQFAPMALGAYGMLSAAEVDADARYHAATIHLMAGDLPAVMALADTILAQAPGHLFGFILRGEAADRRNDLAALTASYRDFLAQYEAQLRSGRVEYTEHQPILEDFLTRARASVAP